uniref:E3 ubiquitin-protein ligase RBX1 n=1 Tax=Bos mutus grunniens TaxID=30521 RepID=A0A8B9WUU4_BOSMU
MAAAMDVDTPSGTNSGAGKKRFEVKKWNAVALWAWDIVVDNCAICRNHIMDLSCFSLPLHLSLAQNTAGVSVGQQRVGIPKVGVPGCFHFVRKVGLCGQCHSWTHVKLEGAQF